MQKVVKVRDTKFGIAMVLEADTMVLGFKVDPYDALKKVVKEIQSLHQVCNSCPIFGVEYSVTDEGGEGPATHTTDVIQEEVELIDTKRDTLAVSLKHIVTRIHIGMDWGDKRCNSLFASEYAKLGRYYCLVHVLLSILDKKILCLFVLTDTPTHTCIWAQQESSRSPINFLCSLIADAHIATG